MARKKYDDYEQDHDHQDRWLVSYADFITLLFAFFVVMYAISSVNESKYRALADSLINAFGSAPTVPAYPGDQPVTPPVQLKPTPLQKRNSDALRREKEHMTRIARDILQVLAPLINEGKVRVTQTERGVRVEINASVLFAPGDAKLADETSEALKAVAAVLKDDHHSIQVEGHTDSVPIRNVLFPSNWELSAVRASSVVRLFVESGVAEERLTAVGRGSTQPVAGNDTAEGRLRNRRVTVMILSALREVVTEVPVEAATAK
ncbi:MAG: chemotaxis protein MotB [Burkholderiales bacterium]|jgi:chemotaxis protein MotB